MIDSLINLEVERRPRSNRFRRCHTAHCRDTKSETAPLRGGGGGGLHAFLTLYGGSSTLMIRTLLGCLLRSKPDMNQPNHTLYEDISSLFCFPQLLFSSFHVSKRITIRIAVVKNLGLLMLKGSLYVVLWRNQAVSVVHYCHFAVGSVC